MAEIITDEGVDLIMAIFPKNGTNLATSYCGLFTGLTQTTVPAQSAVLSTYGAATFGEASYSAPYARQSIAAASWGAQGSKTIWAQTARGSTAGQVSFPAATGSYATQINGFFIADALAHGSEKGIFYSNFDDSTGIASMAIGDIIKVTPTFGLLP